MYDINDKSYLERLQNLSEEAHRIAVEKGWWESDRDLDTITLLMQSELFEAFEDYRNNRGLTEIWFEDDKPCGIPTELADYVIRVLDSLASLGVDLVEGDTVDKAVPFETVLVEAVLGVSFARMLRIESTEKYVELLLLTVRTLFCMCERNGIDLWSAIDQKMAYNRTRPHRHGGKRV